MWERHHSESIGNHGRTAKLTLGLAGSMIVSPIPMSDRPATITISPACASSTSCEGGSANVMSVLRVCYRTCHSVSDAFVAKKCAHRRSPGVERMAKITQNLETRSLRPNCLYGFGVIQQKIQYDNLMNAKIGATGHGGGLLRLTLHLGPEDCIEHATCIDSRT